jgi:hypothetical protein
MLEVESARGEPVGAGTCLGLPEPVSQRPLWHGRVVVNAPFGVAAGRQHPGEVPVELALVMRTVPSGVTTSNASSSRSGSMMSALSVESLRLGRSAGNGRSCRSSADTLRDEPPGRISS